jgi:hypothetical protein
VSEDAHCRTAALVFGKDPAEVTDGERAQGKAMNLAVAVSVDEEIFTNHYVSRALEFAGRNGLDPAALTVPEEMHRAFLQFLQKVLGVTLPELESVQMWEELEELDGGTQP